MIEVVWMDGTRQVFDATSHEVENGVVMLKKWLSYTTDKNQVSGVYTWVVSLPCTNIKSITPIGEKS